MPRGGQPKPTALKLLQGNPGRRPLNALEPQYGPADPTPPEWLEGHALALWKRLAPGLIRQGVLTEIDREFFAAGCERWGVYRRATAEAVDLLAESKAHGLVTNPLQALARSALADASAIFREFGIGASSRSRVKGSPPAGDDDFAKYFG